jgi:5-hydroxyisourate hydrolase-like protein (transthyretin family)
VETADGSSNTTVGLTLEGGQWTGSFDTTSMNNGNHTVYVQATDRAGNTNTTARTDVEFDNGKPSISFDNPTSGAEVTGTTQFTVTIDDPEGNDDISTYQYRMANNEWKSLTQQSGNTFTGKVDTTTVDDGQRSFEVRADDKAGNSRKSSITVTVDNTAPDITGISASDNLVTPGSTVTISADISDSGVGIDQAVLEDMHGRTASGSNTTVCGPTEFTDGDSNGVYECSITVQKSRSLMVTANDTLGNEKEDFSNHVEIEVDDLVPEVSITSLTSGEAISGSSASIQAEVREEFLTLDNHDFEGGSTGAWNYNGVSSSGYTTGSSCEDENSDGTAGCARFDGGVYPTTIAEQNISSGLTRMKGHATHISTEVDLTAVEEVCVESSETYSGQIGGEDDIRLHITAWDGSGTVLNEKKGVWASHYFGDATLKIDEGFQVPSGTEKLEVQLDGGDFCGSQANALDVYFDDITVVNKNLDSGSVKYALENSTGNFSASGTGFGDMAKADGDLFSKSIDTTGLKDGTYDLWVKASDTVGNGRAQEVTDIEVDNTPPDITYTAPSASDVTGSQYFNLTINDELNNSAPNQYEYKIVGETGYQDLTQGTDNKYYTQIDTSSYSDGTYTFKVEATDSEGNTGTNTKDVTFDNNAPQITINRPSSEKYVRNTITVEADIDDDVNNGDSSTYECRIGSQAWVSMSQVTGTTYSCEVDTTKVSDGARNIEVRANDTFDQQSTKSVSVRVDNTAPVVDTVEINDTIVQSNKDLEVDVSINQDDSSSMSYVEVDNLNNLSFDNSENVWTGITQTDYNNDNTVNVLAVDKAGNTGTNTSISYTLDNSQPTFSDVSRNLSYIQSGERIKFSARVNDNHFRSADITVIDSSGNLVKDVSETCTESSTYADCSATWNGIEGGSNAGDGDYRFKIYSEDKADNTNTLTHPNEFTVDNTKPDISGLEVNDSYIDAEATVGFDSEVSDRTFNSSKTDITLVKASDGSYVKDVAESCSATEPSVCEASWNPDSVAEGNYTFKVSSTDNAGNSETVYSSSEWVRYDDTAPTVDNVRINDSIVQTGMAIRVNATTPGDTNSTLDYVNVDGYVDLSYQGSNLWEGVTTGGADGDNVIDVSARDLAGNIGSNTSVSYIIDDRDPKFYSSSRNDSYIQSGDTVKFSTTVNETYFRTADVTVRNSEGLVYDVNENCGSGTHNRTCNATWDGKTQSGNVADGNYTFRITAEDEADNTNSLTLSNEFTVDNTAPQYSSPSTNVSYVKDGETAGFTVEIDERTFSSSDTDIKVINTGSEIVVYNPAESCTGSGSSYTCSSQVNPDTEGNYTFRISSTDRAGNTKTRHWDSEWFYMDSTPPTVQSVNLNDSIVQTGDSIEVWADITDNIDVDTVEADETPLTYNGSYWEGVVTAKQDETVNITAIDPAGNIELDNTTGYTVDNTDPSADNLDSNASFNISQSDSELRFTVEASDKHLRTVEIEDTSGSFIQMTELPGNTYEFNGTPADLGMSSEGTYNITAKATDKADNIEKTYYQLEIDNTAPTVSNIVLNDTIVKPNSSITVNASASDSNLLKVTANGYEMGLNSGTWKENIKVNRSTKNPVNITAIDKAGNTASGLSDNYFIDSKEPEINEFSTNASFNITRSDAVIKLMMNTTDEYLRQAYVNSTALTDNGLWTASLRPEDIGCSSTTGETCNLLGRSVDKADNTAEKFLNITIDNRRPQVDNLHANDTIVQPGDSVGFSAEVHDMFVNRTELRNSSGKLCELSNSVGDNYSCSIEVGETDDYVFFAEDKAGNLNRSESIRVEVDGEKPEITGFGSNATFNTAQSTSALKFNASVTDENLDNVSINGTSLENVTDNEWTLNTTPASLGCSKDIEKTCTLELKAYDKAGNFRKSMYDLTVDDIKPNISEVQINDSIVQSNALIHTVVDAGGETDTSLDYVEVEGEEITWNGSYWTGDVRIDNDGYVNVTAVDKAGNSKRNSSLEYTIDDNPPDISGLDSDASFDYSRSDESVDFSVQASDQYLAEVYILNKSNGKRISLNNLSGENYSKTLEPVALGCQEDVKRSNCTVEALAVDKAENRKVTTYELTIDDESPNITDVTPAEQILQPDSVVNLDVSIENERNWTLRQIEAEGQNLNTSDTHSWNGDIQIDNDGVFNVSAEDKAGNTGENSSVEYTVDYEKPFIGGLSSNYSNDVMRSNSTAKFSVNAFDENGLESVELENVDMVGSAPWTLISTPENLGCSANADCELSAKATDKSGRINSTSYEITVDDKAPVMGGFEALNASKEGSMDSAKGEWYLDWQLNLTDLTNTTVEIFATNRTTGERLGPSAMMNYTDNGTYELVEQPAYFNATNGTYMFKAKAVDSATNKNMTSYLLDVSAQPPKINRIFASDSTPEEARQQFQIKSNITGSSPISSVVGTLNGSSVSRELNLSLVNKTSENSTYGGIFATNYTAPENGYYDVTITAENSIDEVASERKENLFRAIGETSGKVTASTTERVFENITQASTGNLLMNITFNNTGLATAYDADISKANTPSGILSNSSRVACGNVANSSLCRTMVQMNVTADADTGLLSTYLTAGWTNPEGSPDSASNTEQFEVLPNPVLKETTGDANRSIYWGTPTNVTNFTVYSFGNVELKDIESVGEEMQIGSSSYMLSSDYRMYPETTDVPEGERNNMTLQANVSEKGNYRFRIGVNATGNTENCEIGDCYDTKVIGLDVYRKLSTTLENQSKELFRDNYSLSANVTNEQGQGIQNYGIGFYDNGTLIENTTTDSSGEASVDWTAYNVSAGVHNITTRIWNNESRYLKAWKQMSSREITLNDTLSLNATLQDDEMYWYDTQEDHNVTLNYTVETREGLKADDATVELYSNASGSFRQVESCLTNATGSCEIVYNTNQSQASTTLLRSKAVKNQFYRPSANVSDYISILGGFSVEVDVPETGVSRPDDEKLVVGTSQLLNASVTNPEGQEVTPDGLNWTLNTTDGVKTIGSGKEDTWNVWNNLSYGTHELKAVAKSSEGDIEENNVTVEIYEPVNVSIISVSGNSLPRKNSTVNATAKVMNTRTDSAVSGYSCNFYDNNELINTANTNSTGKCAVSWNTSKNDYVGVHNLTVDIKRNTTRTWYLPVENSDDQVEIDLTESLETEIIRPSGNVQSYRQVDLDAFVENAFGEFEKANVTWNTNKTGINASGQETLWNTSGLERGPLNLSSEAFYGNYSNSTDTKVLAVFGRSEVKFKDESQYRRGEIVNFSTEVLNSETGRGIQNYPVTIYRKHESNNTSTVWKTGTTGPGGLYNFTWDSSGTELGAYNVTTNIGDNSTLYYNATELNETQNLFIGGELNLDIERVYNSTVYRDSYSRPRETVITANASNRGSEVPDANVTFLSDGEEIGGCITGTEGLCNFTWNPDNSTEIGDISVNAFGEAENYFRSETSSTEVTIRTAAKASWNSSTEKVRYNFSTDEGIKIRPKVLEEFTDQGINDYPVNVSWGQRKEDRVFRMNASSWTNTGKGKLTTGEGLKLNNTTATIPADIKEREEIKANISNSTENISISIRDDNSWKKIEEFGEGLHTAEFNETPVTEARVSTNGTAVLENLEIRDTDLENSHILMERKVVGSNTAIESDDMDFDPGQFSNSYRECKTDNTCYDDTYVGETPGYSDNVEGLVDKTVFGTEGLLLNVSNLEINESVSVLREYDDLSGGEDSFEDAEFIEFWTNSTVPVNFSMSNSDKTCSASREFNGSDSWKLVQADLTEYKNSCGDMAGSFEISFVNNGTGNYSGMIGVDEVSRLQTATTGSSGSTNVTWLPSETGNYSFKLEIDPKRYYNVSRDIAFKKFVIESGGGGESLGEETGGKGNEEQAPESSEKVTDFQVEPKSLEATVAANTYGNLGEIEIENNATGPLALGVSEVENAELLRVQDSVKLEYQENKDLNIGFNSSEPGDYNATLAVFKNGSQQRANVNITVHVRNISMEISQIKAENGIENITAGDTVTAEAKVLYNGSKAVENATWNTEIAGVKCPKTGTNYVNRTDTWKINCTAPEIQKNPINVNYELTSEAFNLEIKDSNSVKYTDVTAPFVTSKTGEDVNQGEKASLTVQAFDNVNISGVEGTAVYLENGSSEEVQKIDFVEENGLFKAELTETDSKGDYDVITNITDVNGHVRKVRIPVSVFPSVEFTGSMKDTRTEFEFQRPSSNTTLMEASTDSSYNLTVQNRSYDINMDLEPDMSGVDPVHTVEFVETEISENMTDPVSVEAVETGESVGFEHPEGTTNRSFTGLSVSSNLNFSTASVDLNYSRNEDYDEDEEKNLRVFKCEYDDISRCSSGNWTMLKSSVNASENVVEASTNSTSSYIVERLYTPEESEGGDQGENNQDQQGGENQQDESGGSIGGSIGGAPNTGDDSNQSEQENKSDVATEPFVLSPRIFRPIMFRGEERTFILEVDNNRNRSIELDMSIQGEIRELLGPDNSEINISANSTAITELRAVIPDDAEIKTYSGHIVAEYGNTSFNSSQSILVAREGIDGFDLNVKSLTKNVEPGSNFSFETRVSQITMETPVRINMTHYFRESDTDKVIRELNDSIEIEDARALQRELSTQDIPSGSYYVQTVADASNKTVVDTATVVIEERFWTPFKTRASILILAVLLISVIGWKGYQYYWTRKEEESRYVFPVDYDRLPAEEDDNYWVGKIAETEKDAYINPSDLTTHAIVSGSTGSGKSVTANVIAEEALENDVPVIVFDPTAQWTGFVKELKDDDLEDHYSRFEMDPQEDSHPYRGVIKEISSENPDINFEELQNDGEITVFTLNQLTTEEFDGAVRNIIDQIFDKEWEESPDLEMLIVFDEVHRLLEEYGGKGGYEALEKGAREFRKWGIGLMMASQVTADFKQAISGNIMTEIQMQTKSMEDINRVEKKYGEEFAKRISSEDVGTGMIQNSNYNDGEPWFVDFRPTYHNPHKIPDSEMEKYHNLSEEVDGVKKELKKREEQGQDTRDKDLELQLAENKLKEGRFKMANMYIDSLKDEMDIE